MSITNLNKVILKAEYSRRYPDPLNKMPEGDPYNIEHHILVTRAVDVPSGISKAPNPREQDIDHGIYRDIQASLRDEDDPTFHLKNKGITMLAHRVEYDNDVNSKIATIFLGEKDGIADGAHTYEIILDAISKNECPENQFVKFEVITGVPEGLGVDITGGLNTAVQVQEASLENLQGRFDWIKEELKDCPYSQLIAYKQNEDKPYDVRDVISWLTLFNINLFPKRAPKEAYTSKAACLSLYKDHQDTYEMLRPILKDILVLHDYVDVRSREKYNKQRKENGGKGRAGGMKGVFEFRKRGKYTFHFINEESEARLYTATLYPMLGALRFLVEQKKGDRNYSWKLGSFEEVKRFFDEVAYDLVLTTYNTSLDFNYKPNAVGKSDNHWQSLYQIVALHYYSRPSGN